MSDPVRPFSQGTQFMDWLEGNCVLCSKSYDENNKTFVCEIEEALTLAAFDAGEIPAEIAGRLGVPKRKWTAWRCREFVPIGELTGVRRNDLPGQGRLPFNV